VVLPPRKSHPETPAIALGFFVSAPAKRQEVAMHKTLLLVVVLLCGCQSQPIRTYDTAQADYVRKVMTKCATIIAEHAFMLPPEQRDWHYQRCLVQSNVTI
jgi:hypothetical protein